MSVIDLRAQTSFNYSVNYLIRDQWRQSLQLGCDKIIYLHFNMPITLHNLVLLGAKLILFKLPHCTCETQSTQNAEDICNQYALYPLSEIFNVYGCTNIFPAVSQERCISFETSCQDTYTEIDITQIVQDWSSDTIENNGIMLMGKDHAAKIYYASSQHRIPELRPMLRLICKNMKRFHTLRTVACDVEVSRPTSDAN